ncbi:hypothetical protein HAX54_024194, partial [Datura stramonium]|nr:hypothetical protein [Datura stramonium]
MSSTPVAGKILYASQNNQQYHKKSSHQRYEFLNQSITDPSLKNISSSYDLMNSNTAYTRNVTNNDANNVQHNTTNKGETSKATPNCSLLPPPKISSNFDSFKQSVPKEKTIPHTKNSNKKDEIHKTKDVPYETKEGAQPADMCNNKNLEDQWKTQKRKKIKGSSQNNTKKKEKPQQVYKPVQTKAAELNLTLQQDQIPRLDSEQGAADNPVQNDIMVQHVQSFNISQEQAMDLEKIQGQNLGLKQDAFRSHSQQIQLMGSGQHLEQRSKAVLIDSNVDSTQVQVAGLDQQLETSLHVQNLGLKHADFRGNTQGNALFIDQNQDFNSSLEQNQELEQMYLQRSLTGEGTLVEGSSKDQSSRSKSKNKLSKKRRDAIKRKMDVEKGISKPIPSFIVDKAMMHLFLQNLYIQERTNSIPIQTDQVDTNKRKGEVLQRRHQQEGRNKEGVGTNFILVTKQAGLTVSPLQIHESPPRDCTLNSIPAMLDESDDEYRVIHYEDELDQDSQSVGDKE